MLITLVSIFAPLISIIKLIPQCIDIYRNRNDAKATAGVSVAGLWMATTLSYLWIILGIDLRSVTVILPSALQVIIGLTSVRLMGRKILPGVVTYGAILAAYALGAPIITISAIIATTLSVIGSVPQFLKVINYLRDAEKLKAVSAASAALTVLNAALWLLLAYNYRSVPLAVPSLVNGSLALATLALLAYARRNR